MPKVSIIVPIYNAEHFLEKTIMTILNQTFKDYELILVNDGSKDNSLSVCQKFAETDSRIVVIDQENKGAGGARNTGILAACGQYMMFVDADDFCENNMIECMVQKIEQDKADWVICGYNIVQKDKNVLKLPESENVLTGQGIFDNFLSLGKNLLFNSLWNKIYLTDIIKNNNILIDETLIVGEDFKFNLDYIDKCKSVSFVKKPLYNYVVENSYTTKRYREGDFECRAKNVEAYINFCEKHAIGGNGYFQYVKLLFSTAVQLNSKSCEMTGKEKRKYLKKIIDSDTMQMAIAKCSPEDMVSRILINVIKTKNAGVILTFANIIDFVKKHHIIKWNRVSI